MEVDVQFNNNFEKHLYPYITLTQIWLCLVLNWLGNLLQLLSKFDA